MSALSRIGKFIQQVKQEARSADVKKPATARAPAQADVFEARPAPPKNAVKVPDPAALQRFIEEADAVYREELGRPLMGTNVDSAGVAAYSSHFINSGMTIEQVRAAVRQSPEWASKHPGAHPGAAPRLRPSSGQVSDRALYDASEQLKAVYREELGREVDPSGLAHFSAALVNGRATLEGIRSTIRASEEYDAHVNPPAPPAPPPVAKRTGRVRLEGTSFADDGGKFQALGTTYMAALSDFQKDRPRLEATLEKLSKAGFDSIRVLGVVGDTSRPDYWDGKEADWRSPTYAQDLAALTDLAYDKYGLRIEWTLIGDGQLNTPREEDRFKLVDTFLAMSRGREEKILHFELANESWQNGFAGDEGVDQLRRLTKYMNDRTDILVAASAPDGFDEESTRKLYHGGIADLATYHFDRDTGKTEGHWRPVRQPWEWQYLGGKDGIPTVATNNEPIGPGASVASESDPKRLVSAALVSYLSGLPNYVFHTNAGVRHDQEFENMAGLESFKAMKQYTPSDLSSWSRKNAHWNDSPFKVYAKDERGNLLADTMWPDLGHRGEGAVRAYGAVKGNEFFVLPMGIKGSVTMEPRRTMEFDVINPMTGEVLETKRLGAGTKFELRGDDVFVLKGRYV